jgi:hypothetical protein
MVDDAAVKPEAAGRQHQNNEQPDHDFPEYLHESSLLPVSTMMKKS